MCNCSCGRAGKGERRGGCACRPSDPCPFCDNKAECRPEVAVPHTPSGLTAVDPQGIEKRHNNKPRGE